MIGEGRPCAGIPLTAASELTAQRTPLIREAAGWLAGLRHVDRPSPIVPALRARFDLTAREAIDVIRIATELRADWHS